jgi:4-aminobutyrate aminotransferase / (S)-3-amino-2-methylpropionate transaminase / 5-aminovalerate transaminase
MAGSRNLIERRKAVVPRALGQFAGEATAASAQGARVIDADGRAFIDFAGGIGVMNVGHCDPMVVRAIQEQAERLIHTSIHVATYEPYVALCEKLTTLLPHGDSTKAVLLNSGAEAVENAIKFARQATGRSGVICFSEAFHGRTMMSLTLTEKPKYKVGCGPFAPEVHRVPYPNHFRDGQGLSLDAFVRRELDRMERVLAEVVSADRVAAIILEPVQGTGGFVVAPAGYLRGLRAICDREGIMLIFDEIQSGFGRTGRWGAFEHAGVTPDLSTWAKSMAGGMPLSAVLGRSEVMDKALPGTVGSTFGGNPVACAAALATIASMEEKGMNARAVAIGEVVRARFESIATRSSVVGDVRGLGAMMAIEFCHDGDPARPATEVCTAVTTACRERGVLVLPSGPHGNVIRILGPLVVSDEDLATGLDVIEEAVLAVSVPALAVS